MLYWPALIDQIFSTGSDSLEKDSELSASDDDDLYKRLDLQTEKLPGQSKVTPFILQTLYRDLIAATCRSITKLNLKKKKKASMLKKYIYMLYCV